MQPKLKKSERFTDGTIIMETGVSEKKYKKESEKKGKEGATTMPP